MDGQLDTGDPRVFKMLGPGSIPNAQYCQTDIPFPISGTMTTTKNSRIDSVTLRDDGMLEVIERFPSSYILMSNPPQTPPDKIIKRVYGVDSGLQIALIEEVEGIWIPPKTIAGHYEFN